MPGKNVVKQYVGNGLYHIFNRGVEKRRIFIDAQDYGVFLGYLKEYLSLKDEKILRSTLANPKATSKEKDTILKKLRMNNFTDEIGLFCYCLMPNHFHLLVRQKSEMAIDRFVRSLCTRYAMYFNRKYKRVGSLYQGVYKAVLVGTTEQLLHVTRYIHRNPLSLQGETLQTLVQQPSSYAEYLGKRKTSWINTQEVLANFSKYNFSLSYEAFVAETDDPEMLFGLNIDED